MVKMILENVKGKDLLSSRLVDWKLSDMSSEILANGTQTQLKFIYDIRARAHFTPKYDDFLWRTPGNPNKSLSQLTECYNREVPISVFL